MKKSLLLLSAAFNLIAGTLSATVYSNASWNGAWIASGPVQNYVIFDGAGAITEAGVPGATGSQGTYSITSGGSVSGTIVYMGNSVPFTGTFNNDSTVAVSVMGGMASLTFYKVKNNAVMAGTYDGTVTQTGGSPTTIVNFVVDANGAAVSSSDLTGPISGHLYYSNGKVTGLIKSGASAPFTEIEINASSYNGTTLSGASALTGNKTGTYSLTKSNQTSVAAISSVQFSVYPNPVKDQFVIEGNITNGTLKIYDIIGNELLNTSVTSSKTVVNIGSLNLNNGVYFYTINSAGTTQKTGKFIIE